MTILLATLTVLIYAAEIVTFAAVVQVAFDGLVAVCEWANGDDD